MNDPAGYNGRLPLVVIDIGHSETDRGAVSPFSPGTTEWEYNSRLAGVIPRHVHRAETVVVTRDTGRKGYKNLPAKINAFEPDFILSLHCNAAPPAAFGTEMIHYPGSVPGRQFASILQRQVCAVFGWTERKPGYRGVKTPIEGRGLSLLQNTSAPCVIAEPFFLTNEADHQRGLDRFEELGEAYARAIDEFAEVRPSKGKESCQL